MWVSLSMCVAINKADLDSSCGFRGALADVKKLYTARLTVTILAACPTQIDDQRLVFKQAYKMWRFLALSASNLPKNNY